tara:strand:+ start:2451 stop:3380 length:930 start_codon:yes stop_codon:yes gene_type:complete
MALKIIFMGTPDFAVPTLKSIYKSNHKVLEVYTQPAKKKDRGQKILSSPIYKCAEQFNLKVRCPISLESEEEIDHFKSLNPDLAIVVAYGKILPKKLLNLDKILFINLHASLLPKWRGAAPIQRAIMNMEKETGVSIMKIVEKLDAGPLMLKSKIRLTKESNYTDVSQQMSDIGAKLVMEALDKIESGEASFVNQNEEDATYAKKINKTESKIDWSEKADRIIAKINSLNPNPGCWFKFSGSRIKIIKAKEVKISGEPGLVLDNELTVACYENAIKILELQKEGKKKMLSKEFLKGNKLEKGLSLLTDV